MQGVIVALMLLGEWSRKMVILRKNNFYELGYYAGVKNKHDKCEVIVAWMVMSEKLRSDGCADGCE